MSSDDSIVHFSPWRDFNDAPVMDAPGPEPDPDQIAIFLDVVFGYCDGFIPVRGFVDKGQGFEGRPHNIWIEADAESRERTTTFAHWAAREGAAVYVVPGTVVARGQAKAADIRQMQTIVVDLDAGDIAAKLDHLVRHLGAPTLVVESGGRTSEGQDKLHAWWRLTEPAEGEDIALLCHLRSDIAAKVGGDAHFRSAHQPIRVAGTVYHKCGSKRLVAIRRHELLAEVDLREFAEAVEAMPSLSGVGMEPGAESAWSSSKPAIEDVLVTPVREGAADAFTRFQAHPPPSAIMSASSTMAV